MYNILLLSILSFNFKIIYLFVLLCNEEPKLLKVRKQELKSIYTWLYYPYFVLKHSRGKRCKNTSLYLGKVNSSLPVWELILCACRETSHSTYLCIQLVWVFLKKNWHDEDKWRTQKVNEEAILGGTSVGCDLTVFSRMPNWLEGWYEDDAITICYRVYIKGWREVCWVVLSEVVLVMCKKVLREGTSLVLCPHSALFKMLLIAPVDIPSLLSAPWSLRVKMQFSWILHYTMSQHKEKRYVDFLGNWQSKEYVLRNIKDSIEFTLIFCKFIISAVKKLIGIYSLSDMQEYCINVPIQ